MRDTYSSSEQANRIFIVEDDPIYLRMVKYIVEMNPDHEVYAFENGKQCLDNMHLNPTIVSMDYSLPDIKGEDLLVKIKRANPNTKVIVLSGQKEVAVAVELLKKGASDYIVKDEDTRNRLWNSINLLKENASLLEEISMLKEELEDRYDFGKSMIGNSPAIKKTFKLMEKALKSDITVSVTGETGTGKEVVAKTIHYNSLRKDQPFVAINMSAIPKELIESELFGHEKGAFTGAIARKKGKFELAHKGTLFLDEIAELDLQLQAKLLRVLQERELTRVGGEQAISFDTRIIVATHKDLGKEVQKGRFREDLYYRILGLPIEIPPLREREEDIVLLSKFFLQEFLKKNTAIKKRLRLNSAALNKLMRYPFPGNVRELKAVIELSAVFAEGSQIKAEDIQFRGTHKMGQLLDEEMTMKAYVRKIVYQYLKKYKNVVLVAEKLDVGKSTIYKMLKEDRELKELIEKF